MTKSILTFVDETRRKCWWLTKSQFFFFLNLFAHHWLNVARSCIYNLHQGSVCVCVCVCLCGCVKVCVWVCESVCVLLGGCPIISLLMVPIKCLSLTAVDSKL